MTKKSPGFVAKTVRIVLMLTVLAVIAGGTGAWLIQRGAFTLTMQELEAKYTRSDSRFTEVDGIRVHYVEAGEGPVVVLLHASFMNLWTWDSLAKALSGQYRVIRMDRLLSGLTGVDPKNAYSVERELELLDGLLEQLEVKKFHLLGTSSSGTVAFRYAAQNTDRVASLTLINSAGMPRTAATNPNRGRGNFIERWVQKYYRSKGFWRESISRNFAAPHEPPDWFVNLAYDFNRRDTLAAEGKVYLQNYRTGDPESVLARVTAPTLVLWGMENATVMHLEADVFAYWLKNAPVSKKKYAAAGHYPYVEIPDQVEVDVLKFISGVENSSVD